MARNVLLVIALIGLGIGIGLSCGESEEPGAMAPVAASPEPEPVAFEEPVAEEPPRAEPDPLDDARAKPEPLDGTQGKPEKQDNSAHKKDSEKPPAKTAATRDATRIGVVNLKECFKGERYEYVKEIDAELQKVADSISKERDGLRKQISELDQRIAGLPIDSDLRLELRMQRKVAASRLKFAEEFGRVRYLSLYTKKKTDVFNRVVAQAAVVAKDRGFDLVLRAEEPQLDDDDPLGRESVTARIYRRPVLYYSNTIDITDEVIKNLNAAWQKEKSERKPDPADQKVYFCPSSTCKEAKIELTEEEFKKHGGKCPRCFKEVKKLGSDK